MTGGAGAQTGGHAATGGQGDTGGNQGTGGNKGGTGGLAATGGLATGGSATGGAMTATGGATTGGMGGTTMTGGARTGGSGNPGSGGAGGSSSGGQPATASGLPSPPATLTLPTAAAGTLTVVPWAGYKGAVSYSFDDDNSSQIQHYPELDALKVPFTFYLWTGRTEASNSIWATALKDGHEIGNHTQSHSSNGTTTDIDAATTFIKQKLNVTPWTMAAPNGAGVYTSLANGRFLINRGVANGLIGPGDNSDPFTLPCYIPPTGASESDFNGQVDSARSAGKWRVMVVHGFTGGTDSAYQPVPIDSFVNGVKHTIMLGDMWIGTVQDVGAYWRGQKAFAQATKTSMGSDTTWTWKLPDHFPPGKYLRVVAPAGTVKQGGNTVAKDSHGYYEIALDPGSVTLSP